MKSRSISLLAAALVLPCSAAQLNLDNPQRPHFTIHLAEDVQGVSPTATIGWFDIGGDRYHPSYVNGVGLHLSRDLDVVIAHRFVKIDTPTDVPAPPRCSVAITLQMRF